MKKILSFILVLALSLSCFALLTACKPSDNENQPEEPKADSIIGVYEMTSITGTVQLEGQDPIALEEGLYEYYIIELKEGGKAVVKSAAAGSSSEIRQEVDWEYNEETGALDIISHIDGMTVVEKMNLVDGVITYTNSQTGQSQGMVMTINMTITLAKKAN